MTRKTRLWIGGTLFVALALNYAMIGIPLMRKSASVQEKYKAVLIKQVKSDRLFKSAEDEYLAELFRKERAAIERKVTVLNCISATALVFIASWVIFGLLARRK